ncbi:TlpA disulfide reductase family protein [uncultured Lacinutrix sp.]|uniref:TlpA family protein disulfide reductase n=1 Tax=uncultured Lacinutrix sp. TaxID=574032 RepID=UPI002638F257|nr:TlpA disulfide reductase family protein [uncultured Lacinutrix sp.]
MKKSIYILLVILAFNFQTVLSQSQMMIDANTVIKDKEGNKVELMKFMSLMQSGEWMVDEKKDKNGNDFLQLRKATKDEKVAMNEMVHNQDGSNELIGTKAPTYTMKDLNGNSITSENTKGKIVVLNFWFAKCKPCIMEIPELNEVYKKYKNNKNVVFASITFDSKDTVNTFLKKHPLQYPVVPNNMAIIGDFGVNSYPTNIIIDKEGNYSNIITGGFPEIGKTIENSIDKAL